MTTTNPQNNSNVNFGLQDQDFATAATLLRVGTFRINARKLYTYFQPQVLEWPSISVAWLPSRKQVAGFRDFSLQTAVVGTQAAKGNLNYLSFVEAAVPLAVEDIDVMLRDEDDLHDADLMEKIPYRRVRGHTRLSQFIAVDGPVLRILNCCQNQEVDTIAVKTAATSNILLYNCFRDRFKFSTDPKRNLPDIVLKPSYKTITSVNAERQKQDCSEIGIGFGLAASECKEGLFVAGGDDGVLHVWDFDADTFIDPPEYRERHENQIEKLRMKNALLKTQQRMQMNPADFGIEQGSENSRFIHTGSTANNNTEMLPPRKPTVLFSCRRLRGHKREITDVSCHGTQPHLIISSSASGHCALWDLRTGDGAVSGLDVVRHANGGVNTVAFHPVAAFQVATGGDDGVVKLWDIRNWKEQAVGEYSYHNKPVQRVAWAPFSDCVFGSCGDDGLVCLWDLNRATQTVSDAGEAGVPKELAFVHAGHAASVPDFSWCPNLNDEWAIASVDHANLLQMWRPNDTAISSNVKADAFDEDFLDEDE